MKPKKLKKNGEPKKSGGKRKGSGQPKKNTFLYRKKIDARIETDFREKAKELIVELLNKKTDEEKANNSENNQIFKSDLA